MARKEKLPVYGIGTFVRLRAYVSDMVRETHEAFHSAPYPEEYVYVRVTEFPSARRISGVDLLTGTLRSFALNKFSVWVEVDPAKKRPRTKNVTRPVYDEITSISKEDARKMVQNRLEVLMCIADDAVQIQRAYEFDIKVKFFS